MDGPFWVDTRAPHIAADIASVTLATTAKGIVPVASLPVLGSNYFSFVGKAVRINLYGRITTGATPGNGTFQLWWGTGADANGTSFLTSAATALTASQTSMTWSAQCIIRCRALGATGSLMAVGWFEANPALISSTLQPLLMPPTAPAAQTLDLTQNFVISPQFLRSGSTAETIQVHEFIFEALN